MLMPLNPLSSSTNLSIINLYHLISHTVPNTSSTGLEEIDGITAISKTQGCLDLLDEKEQEAHMAHLIGEWATPSSRTLLGEPGSLSCSLVQSPQDPVNPSPNGLTSSSSVLNQLYYCAFEHNALFSKYTLWCIVISK